jgi:hypothetical protein
VISAFAVALRLPLPPPANSILPAGTRQVEGRPALLGTGVADIFVSYTSKDRQWAEWIGQQLIALGYVPHIHEWEMPAGADILGHAEQ